MRQHLETPGPPRPGVSLFATKLERTIVRLANISYTPGATGFPGVTLGGVSLPSRSTALLLNQCDKLNLISVVYDADLGPSTQKLLHRFIDRPASLLWSSERLAKSIARSVRTVERSLAELRSLGILSTVRRRRQTLLKVLSPDRVVAVGRAGVEAARKACEAAMALLGQGKFFTRQVRRPISIDDIKRVDERAPWRVQGPPSASLRRLAAMLTG